MRLNDQVAEIRRTRAIAADPQTIWDVLADFGAVSSWVDLIDHSCLLSPDDQRIGVGTTRRVQVGRNTLVERITEFSPPFSLSYDVEGFPRRLMVRNRWTLTPSGGTTTVTLISTVTIAGLLGRIAETLVTRVFAKRVDAMLACLTKQLEAQHV